LRDVRRVFLYADPVGVDGFVEAARDAGVEHVVLLSSVTAAWAEGAEADIAGLVGPGIPLTVESDPIAWRHVMAERAIAESGIPWTFVRPGMFATNTLRWVSDIRADGAVRIARPAAQATPIHERDIAAVAVRALLAAGHVGARYSLTGPESISQRRQVELIGQAIGRSLRVVELSDADVREQFARSSSPALAASLVARMIASDGVAMPVQDTVSRVLGRPARTFAEWTVDHAADFE
jgi:uncharacterized protein YbjT (DUF2867 family)